MLFDRHLGQCLETSVYRLLSAICLITRRAVVFALASLGILLVHAPSAAECIDYADYLHWVGGVDTPLLLIK